jgi:hypothetical protein
MKRISKLFSKAILVALLGIILTGTICYAATWKFKFPTYVTDVSGTARTYYPVVLGYNGQDLIDDGYISVSGNEYADCHIKHQIHAVYN